MAKQVKKAKKIFDLAKGEFVEAPEKSEATADKTPEPAIENNKPTPDEVMVGDYPNVHNDIPGLLRAILRELVIMRVNG